MPITVHTFPASLGKCLIPGKIAVEVNRGRREGLIINLALNTTVPFHLESLPDEEENHGGRETHFSCAVKKKKHRFSQQQQQEIMRWVRIWDTMRLFWFPVWGRRVLEIYPQVKVPLEKPTQVKVPGECITQSESFYARDCRWKLLMFLPSSWRLGISTAEVFLTRYTPPPYS